MSEFMDLDLNEWKDDFPEPNRPGQKERKVLEAIGHAITDGCVTGPHLGVAHKHGDLWGADGTNKIIGVDDNKIMVMAMPYLFGSYTVTPAIKRCALLVDVTDSSQVSMAEPLANHSIMGRGHVCVATPYNNGAFDFDVGYHDTTPVITLSNETGDIPFSTSNESGHVWLGINGLGYLLLQNSYGFTMDIALDYFYAYSTMGLS